MSSDPEEKQPEWTEAELLELTGQEPPSNKRDKERATGMVRLYLAELTTRSEGLEGEALAREVNRTLDRIVEHHASAVPRRVRDEARAVMREALENDPSLAPIVAKLRVAKR
jgi:hypothetical protein